MAETLVIVAHADDETLGCGGLLYQMGRNSTEPRRISTHAPLYAVSDWLRVTAHVAVACPERRNRSVFEELDKACVILGVKYREAGGNPWDYPHFNDQRLDEIAQLDLNRWVESILDAHPDARRVFTHWPYDLNRDHRIIAEAVLVATRRLHVNVYAMPIIGTSERGSRPWEPTTWYPLTPEAVDAKLKALAAYGDESTGEHSAMIVNAQMCVWGALIGMDYAETFHLLRGVGIP